MTNTNPRDLIKRLADSLHEAAGEVEDWGNYAPSYFQEKHDLRGNVARIYAEAAEARAYLSQPKPEGPTDEELLAAQDQAVASFPPIHPELSPAAQAVLDAYWKSPWDPSLQHEDRYAIAAALEALADQVVPENYYAVNLYEDSGWVNGLEARNEEVRSELLAIAAELKAQ